VEVEKQCQLLDSVGAEIVKEEEPGVPRLLERALDGEECESGYENELNWNGNDDGNDGNGSEDESGE